MPLQAPRPTLLTATACALALLLGLAAPDTQALGLGRPQVLSALGKPLDVSVPLSLADGEQLTEACARAEVSAGDARVPAGLLQLRIEGVPGQQRIRLQSLVRIDEPALRITLALGCPLRLTREFNAFVDPPAGPTAAPVAEAPPPAPVAAPVPAALPPSPAAAPAKEARRPVSMPRPRLRPRAPARASGPRLVLERPEVLVESPAVQAAASAPALEMTPELEAQIAALEQTVAQLRAELEAKLQAQEAASAASVAAPMPPAPVPLPAPAVRGAHYRDPMSWLLALGLGLLAGAGGYNLSRWRDERTRRERAYWQALQAAEGAAAEPRAAVAPSPGIAPQVPVEAALVAEDSVHVATRPQPRPLAWSPALAAEPVAMPTPSPAIAATQPMPAPAAAVPLLAQEFTLADELLDLRQQVDFLQLLGQQDAAADLLVQRLKRSDVGAMPLLMLMEMCQQRGEPEAFAELAARFERQVGVPPPDWTQSLARGRGLDACASVIAHLQVVWSDPVAAMQMLQDLIARGGGPGVQQFELPAYDDLLMLYGVARDLYESAQRSDDVDVVLPLDSRLDAGA